MNQFGKDTGLLHQAAVVGRELGAGREFWTALQNREAFRAAMVAVRPFIAEETSSIVKLTLADTPLLMDKTRAGWKIVREVDCPIGETYFGLVSPFAAEGMLRWAEIFDRSCQIGASLHQRIGEAFVRTQKLPVAWQSFTIALTGTVWENQEQDKTGKKQYISCVQFSNRWQMFFRPVSMPFGNDFCFPYYYTGKPRRAVMPNPAQN